MVDQSHDNRVELNLNYVTKNSEQHLGSGDELDTGRIELGTGTE
jgi:hypothetical protein